LHRSVADRQQNAETGLSPSSLPASRWGDASVLYVYACNRTRVARARRACIFTRRRGATPSYAGFTHARDAAAAAAAAVAAAAVAASPCGPVGKAKREREREREEEREGTMAEGNERRRRIRERGRRKGQGTRRETRGDREKRKIRAAARGNFAVQLSPGVCCLPFAENIRNSSVVTTRRRSIRGRPTAFPNARQSVPELPRIASNRYSRIARRFDCGPLRSGARPFGCVLDNEIRRKLCHNGRGKLTLRGPAAAAAAVILSGTGRASGLPARCSALREGPRERGRIVVPRVRTKRRRARDVRDG